LTLESLILDTRNQIICQESPSEEA